MWELRILAVVGLIATAILTTVMIIVGFALAGAARRAYQRALRRGGPERSEPAALAKGLR
jgi:hypothetical protein